MILYHRAPKDAVNAILEHGFKDGSGHYLTTHTYSGVWLSNVPLDENEGACGDCLLEVLVELSDGEIAKYEWIEDGKPYREFLVPASVVNPVMHVRIART